MRAVPIIAALLLPACATAQHSVPVEAEAACAAPATPFAAARPLASVTGRESLPAARFAVGEAVALTLHPDGEVAYVSLPKGEGEESSFGGIAAFGVAEAGVYRVGLSEPVWVDVVEQGKPAEAGKFGRGEPCSGIRKGVEFALQPGEHVLEISGGIEPSVAVIVERMR